MILFVCAALTVAIETPFMYLLGCRNRDEVLLIICVNVATNLLLNLGLGLGFAGREPGTIIYALEAIVVAVEYVLYALAMGKSLRLFLLTLAANCLSYGIGLIIF